MKFSQSFAGNAKERAHDSQKRRGIATAAGRKRISYDSIERFLWVRPRAKQHTSGGKDASSGASSSNLYRSTRTHTQRRSKLRGQHNQHRSASCTWVYLNVVSSQIQELGGVLQATGDDSVPGYHVPSTIADPEPALGQG